MAPLAANSSELRRLPSIEKLAGTADSKPRALAIAAARLVVADLRRRLLAGEVVDLSSSSVEKELAEHIDELSRSSLRPVINATGVALHTNLGRAPLAPAAAEAAALAGASYTNLEYNLISGGRGSRQTHVEPTLRELTGAQAALAVNNNAAAVLLALAALVGDGEVVIGRGQLIEIGGSFRIPEILAQAGARLIEVGTTNRTRLSDYVKAIGPDTKALLRVHRSNFHTVGFTEEVPLSDLGELAEDCGLPLIDDLGSGAVQPIEDEPPVRASVEAKATVVCCSADKLLGGPQAGLLVGTAEAIARCREHPLARAVRIDKMQLAALEATLHLHRFNPDSVPVAAMLAASDSELRQRAERLAGEIGRAALVRDDRARAGGGSLPGVDFDGPVCAVDPTPLPVDDLVASLRHGDPPVIARISQGKVVLDPRTIAVGDVTLVGELVRTALADG